MSVQYKTHFTYRGRSFDATWEGGAYIDVRFGGTPTPTEVINVWDYETDKPYIPFTQNALHKALKRWVFEQDNEAEDWAREQDQPVDDWYAAYIENARY